MMFIVRMEEVKLLKFVENPNEFFSGTSGDFRFLQAYFPIDIALPLVLIGV